MFVPGNARRLSRKRSSEHVIKPSRGLSAGVSAGKEISTSFAENFAEPVLINSMHLSRFIFGRPSKIQD